MLQKKQNPMEDIEKVLKNKSRDPMGFANELFQSNVAGNDLKVAILQLMNRIKSEQIFPQLLESVNITSILKNKGSRNEFEFYRGIFRVPIIRTIMDRLIYNDEYVHIDKELKLKHLLDYLKGEVSRT